MMDTTPPTGHQRHRRTPSDPTNGLQLIPDEEHELAATTAQEVTKHLSKRSLFSFRSGPIATRKSNNPHPTTEEKRGHHRRWNSVETAAALNGEPAAATEDHSWFRGRRGRTQAPSSDHQPPADDLTLHTHVAATTTHPADLVLLAHSPRPGCLGLLQRPGSGKYPPSIVEPPEGTDRQGVHVHAMKEEDPASSTSQDSPRCSDGDAGVSEKVAHETSPGGGKKVPGEKGTRRSARALSSLLPKMAFRRTDSGADLNGMANGDAASSNGSGDGQQDPTPDEATRAETASREAAAAAAAAARTDAPPSPVPGRGELGKSMRCFGRPLVADEDDSTVVATEEVVLDAGEPYHGVVGLYNLGNTCFVNAAVQCIRFTPGLALQLVPDLFDPLPVEDTPIETSNKSPVSGNGTANTEAAVDEQQPPCDAVTPETAPLSCDDGEAIGVRPPLLHGPSSRAQCEMCSPRNSMQIVGHHTLNDTAVDDTAVNDTAVNDTAVDDTAVNDTAVNDTAVNDTATAPETAGDALNDEAMQAADNQHPAAPSAEEPGCVVQRTPQSDPADPLAGNAGASADAHQQDRFEGDEPSPSADPHRTGSKPARKHGAVLEAFRVLLRSLHGQKHGASVDPTALFRALRGVPGGSDLCDGGQHDCQEVFRVLLDGLHGDLQHAARSAAASADPAPTAEPLLPDNALPPLGQPSPEKESPEPSSPVVVESEDAKADRLWQEYLRTDDSLMTRLFGGQLQSSVLCHKCSTRFTMYEPFVDLSLPLGREGKGLGWFGSKTPATIADCLTTFTADELLQGNEAFFCDKCQERCNATKRMRLHRLPPVLVLHIKRFKFKGTAREKLTTNVTFPLRDLQLSQFVSDEVQLSNGHSLSTHDQPCQEYDLFAVSQHFGNMVGGHYTATCMVPPPGADDKAATRGAGAGAKEVSKDSKDGAGGKEDPPRGPQWWTFNDDQVSRIAPQSVVSNTAYMLFYVRKDCGSNAAAVAAAAVHAV